MHSVLFQCDMFCRHLSGSFNVCCHLILRFLCWFFCLDDLSIGDRGVLKSPTTTALGSICCFKSFSICLMKLCALKLGSYRLIIVISSWCIAPFIIMKWPSLSLLTNVSLKSFSDITIATLACFRGLLA
jgi:hypothetical protein